MYWNRYDPRWGSTRIHVYWRSRSLRWMWNGGWWNFESHQTSSTSAEGDCYTTSNALLLLLRVLQGVLTKSKYYSTIGLLAETALSRVLRDVLSLPDIPELESHRLSELCRILNSMEGLFSEDPDQVWEHQSLKILLSHHILYQASFVVAYVPSWLKFSYLSELLVCFLHFSIVLHRWLWIRRHLWRTSHTCSSRVLWLISRLMNSCPWCERFSRIRRYGVIPSVRYLPSNLCPLDTLVVHI